MVFLVTQVTDNCSMGVEGQCCFTCGTAACGICESSVIFVLVTVVHFKDKTV